MIQIFHQGFIGQEAHEKRIEGIDARLFRLGVGEPGTAATPAAATPAPEPAEMDGNAAWRDETR